jgi:argininosuccinate lyase/amino-acid N-acetyltransferase
MEATAFAEYLVARGIVFRDAHHIVGEIVQRAEAGGKTLAELDLEVMKQVCSKIDKDIYSLLSCEKIPDQVVSIGGTGREEIRKNLAYWEARLPDSGHDK